MPGPLAGYRIVDASPRILGDPGADVFKVEPALDRKPRYEPGTDTRHIRFVVSTVSGLERFLLDEGMKPERCGPDRGEKNTDR